MNGDTITVNVPYKDSHRVKRIKVEQINQGSKSTSRASRLDRASQTQDTQGDTIEIVGKMETHSKYRRRSAVANTDTVGSQVIQAAIGNTNLLSTQNTREPSTLSIQGLSKLNEPDENYHLTSITPYVDFSNAPSEPAELAWWVAQQITHFRSDSSESPVTDDENYRRLTSHPPGLRTRHSDAGLEPEQITGRQKLRDDNRDRKKRWRESNALKNKDNDLRCRIYKRARSEFGVAPSAEKTAYIEAEYNKRRNKRESKQRARALEAGEFPVFTIAPELSERIFSLPNLNISSEVQAAGAVLMNTLFGVDSGESGYRAKEAADVLKAAVSKSGPQPFVDALKIMGKNAELMKGIVAKLDLDGENESSESLSGDETGSQPLQSAEPHSGSASSQGSALNHQSNEIIRALNAATALLNQMSDTKTYASPYGNPPPPTVSVNGHGQDKTNGTAPSNPKPDANGHGLDQSQIDALLALANGGSLTDDEDDKTIADPDEVNGLQPEQSGQPQVDTDITATLHRIITQLTAEKKGSQTTEGVLGLPLAKVYSTPYGSQSVQDQAATLQSLFSQAGVAINTIIPAAQSHATSQLYAHLSSRARSSTPSGSAKSAHTSAYGSNTSQMQQRMLAKSGVSAQNSHQQQHPPMDVDSVMRGNLVGIPTRPRNLEEQKNIRGYGFPPLPGSRPGASMARDGIV